MNSKKWNVAISLYEKPKQDKNMCTMYCACTNVKKISLCTCLFGFCHSPISCINYEYTWNTNRDAVEDYGKTFSYNYYTSENDDEGVVNE